MGNCQGLDDDGKRSNAISRQLKQDFKAQQNIIKLLLLGTGESGKSTIVKQMKIIHGTQDSEQAGLTDADRTAQVEPVRNNVLDSIEVLLTVSEEFGYPLKDPQAEAAKMRVLSVLNNIDRAQQYSPEIGGDVALLWDNPGIQQCVARKNEFQLLDSATYFLKQAVQLASLSYVPTDEDVLRARTITTGIVTVPFRVKNSGFNFELVDVGGQRTERRKWIHVFQDVTAVMFIISLSDYNQTLYEDETTNRMQESEKLFGEMLNNVFFRDTPFIVFFNKFDLFVEKLKSVSLTIAYREYTGTQDSKEALDYIKYQRFLCQDNNPDREIFPFNTTATDTTLITNVISSIRDIIMQKILKQTGFD